ncbi:MAG: PIG-L family deacetylase [Pseudomonadota bacterium]
MPNAIQSRLLADANAPWVALIWRAMACLKSSVSFLNAGAHPDDETSGMLASLWLRDGVNLAYACSTRGEGGQNDIGTETGTVLGTLRTAEMEAAAAALDMRLYWHSQRTDDAITDFGFSKSGDETMHKWGKDRLMRRFVEIVRAERPDILCPTFLDIPGQHGHHRAMTAAAHEVIGRAADPSYDPDGAAPWQVAKLYLPAWSGAGGAYDDELPPPPATISVPGKGADPVLGASYARIGEYARQFHRSQGMGRWVPPDAEHDWPLHLAASTVGADSHAITDNLPADLSDIGCHAAARAVGDCLSAFPDGQAMMRPAAAALAALRHADVAPEHAHRVARKSAQLSRILYLCLQIDARAFADQTPVSPGQTLDVVIETRPCARAVVAAKLIAGDGQTASERGLTIAPEAPPSDPYPDSFDPLAPRAPCLAVEMAIDGITAAINRPLEPPILVRPANQARLSETAAIVNLATQNRTVSINVTELSPGKAAFALPEGWRQSWSGGQVAITVPDAADPGLFALDLRIDGEAAATTHLVEHGHIAARLHHASARLHVRLAHVTPPEARIGYVGAGNDRVADWLSAAGFAIEPLQDADLLGDAPFDRFDTILVGVFAYRFRAQLAAAIRPLNAWVRAGGNLVTLYHRPWDNWDPSRVPPDRLEIGQPSLRWRITDEDAEVTVLEPAHPVFAVPNKIGPADWEGWQKERGLYFAKSWSPAYTPVLRMADPGEAPLDGALLIGRIGAGRHAHVALNLHHQVAQLVPGAYRLFSNLLQPSNA